MPTWSWLTVHQAIGVLTFALTVALAARLLRMRRPAGSSTAWLLGFLLLPYIAIPLFLVLGDRKLGIRQKHAIVPLRHPEAARQDRPDRPIEWLDTPEGALARLTTLIRGAARSVHLSTYVLADDEVARGVIEELTARARAGVEVCILLDGLFAPRAPRGALAALRHAGGRVQTFLPLARAPWRGRAAMRNHRKLAVFDDTSAIVGGMNISDDYLGERPRPARWRDLSIVLAGGPARAVARLFRTDWQFAGGGPLLPEPPGEPDAPTDVTIVPTGPDCAGDPWHDMVMQMVFDARRRLAIATPYFAPDESLLQSLAIAARRDVEVTIVVPERSNHWLSDRVAGQLLRDLAAAGVAIFRYRPAMMHAKCLLVDDDLAAVGSANFNARSLFLDFEVTAVLQGEAHNRRMAAWFAETLRDCDPGPPVARGMKAMVESLARLLSPLV